MGERHIRFSWSREFGKHFSLNCKGPVFMRRKRVVAVIREAKRSISGVSLHLQVFWNVRGLTSTCLKREGTENLFAILALLLSVLLGPTESFFNTRPVRQNGRKTYPF